MDAEGAGAAGSDVVTGSDGVPAVSWAHVRGMSSPAAHAVFHSIMYVDTTQSEDAKEAATVRYLRLD